MLAHLSIYLSAAYLLSPAPYAETGPGIGHLLWALLCLALGLWALQKTQRRSGASDASCWRVIVAMAAITLLTIGWQVWGWGALSARVWGLTSSALSLYLACSAHRAAYARRPPHSPNCVAALIAGHLAGIALVIWQLPTGWLLVATALALAGLGALQANKRQLPLRALAPLTPLFLLYVSLSLRAVLAALNLPLTPYDGATFPNPATALLSSEALAIFVLTWCWVRTAASMPRNVRVALLAMPLVACLVWFGVLLSRHLSAGATGSDPYAYLQMASDLADHGTPLHYFSLADMVERLGLPTWPAVPVGYHPSHQGWAATVWPAGWPLLLAEGLRIGGERAALWLAPLCHLGVTLLTGLLAWELLRDAPRRARFAVAGLSALLVLTSYEALLRTLVPMADAAAALGGVLLFWVLFRAARRDRLAASLLAGCLLGVTYNIRHPQLALGLAAILYLLAPLPNRRRLAHLALYAAGALLLALPDLAYHARVFGSPWIAESTEWPLLAVANIPASWRSLWQDGWWRTNEWGYLWPVLILGLWAMLRQHAWRPFGLALCLSYGACLLFHLSYAALRLRDLVPLFPWLALMAAFGVWRLWEIARRLDWPGLSAVAAVCLALALAARTGNTLSLPFHDQLWTFGYVTPSERDGLESLSQLTPNNAVIATGLNAGAVQRYAGRDIMRPASWRPEEFAAVVDELERLQRPLYVLDDGEEMAQWLDEAPTGMEWVATIDIPRMGLGGQQEAGLGHLYLAVPSW